MEKQKTVFQVQKFKPSGKYYDTFDLELEVGFCQDGKTPYMDDAIELAKVKRNQGQDRSFYWLINHVNGYPCLVLP